MDIGPGLGENGFMRPLTSILSLAIACGPDSAATEGAATTTESTTSDTTLVATTGAPTTGDVPTDTGTTGEPTTSASATSDPATGDATTDVATTDVATTGDATTGDATGTTGASTDSGETTDAGTTGADEVEYAAYFYAGGLDHIFVHRADFTHDRCATLHFAWPGGGDPALKISAPNKWAAVNAFVTPGTADCLAGTPMGDPVAAVGGLGAASWPQGPNEYCPKTLDLDLVLDFPAGQPWVPAQEAMLVTALPLNNCP